GKRLGKEDERNLFCVAIRLIDEIRPKAVMIENVRGILGAIFEDYRKYIAIQVTKMGYVTEWKLLNACDFGVPQIRPRVIFIAIRREYMGNFYWPVPNYGKPPTVGETIYGLMAANGWKGAKAWRDQANDIAPTIVGMLSSRAPSAREKTIWPGWAVPKGGWRRFPGDAGKAYVE
ncbi:MAG TPA: DNA cytosine methyltransferase, partial [bacterium]|nr:DNA cytosine methyltransferase [bacterium]